MVSKWFSVMNTRTHKLLNCVKHLLATKTTKNLTLLSTFILRYYFYI